MSVFFFSGEVLGRQVIDVKPCAAPGRNRFVEETDIAKHSTAASATGPEALQPAPSTSSEIMKLQ